MSDNELMERATRRVWRFGQTENVNVYTMSDNELMERETKQFHADMQRETIDELTAENAKLRAELADCDVKLEEAIDMLVNLYDLGNLDDEWMGKGAMVLAKNDK